MLQSPEHTILQERAAVLENISVRDIPESEQWRLGLLCSLTSLRKTKSVYAEDSKKITAILHSLSKNPKDNLQVMFLQFPLIWNNFDLI